MNRFKYHFLGSLVFLGTLIFWFVVYAGLNWSNVVNVETWNTFTADMWNNTMTNIMNNVNSIDTDINKMWSTITVWGRSDAPAWSTLLYSWMWYSSHYTHNWWSQLCMKWWDPGWTAAWTSYWDLLYPLTTWRATYMPPWITNDRHIKCSNVYIKSTTFEIYWTHTCPSWWNPLYTWYSMWRYYTHANWSSNTTCVDSVNFDNSISYTSTNWAYLVWTMMRWTSDATNYPTNKWVKCAICIKQ